MQLRPVLVCSLLLFAIGPLPHFATGQNSGQETTRFGRDRGTFYLGGMFKLPSCGCSIAPDQSEANKRRAVDCRHQ